MSACGRLNRFGSLNSPDKKKPESFNSKMKSHFPEGKIGGEELGTKLLDNNLNCVIIQEPGFSIVIRP